MTKLETIDLVTVTGGAGVGERVVSAVVPRVMPSVVNHQVVRGGSFGGGGATGSWVAPVDGKSGGGGGGGGGGGW